MDSRTTRAAFVGLTLLLAAPVFASELVHVESGELPIILTVPHGGSSQVPDCNARTPVGSHFAVSVDVNTDILALEIAAGLKRLTGKQPYLVVAKFHRRYIDANRVPNEAYASRGCKTVYDFYHAAARRFVDEVRGKYPHAILIDVHGQTAYRDAILRGTQNGKTVKRLLESAGAHPPIGPDHGS